MAPPGKEILTPIEHARRVRELGFRRAAGFNSNETKAVRIGDTRDHFFDGTWKPSPFAQLPNDEPINATLHWYPDSNPKKRDACHPSLWSVEEIGGPPVISTEPAPGRIRHEFTRCAIPGYRGNIPGKKAETVFGNTCMVVNARSTDLRKEKQENLATFRRSVSYPEVGMPDDGVTWKAPPDPPQGKRPGWEAADWTALNYAARKPKLSSDKTDPIMSWTGHSGPETYVTTRRPAETLPLPGVYENSPFLSGTTTRAAGLPRSNSLPGGPRSGGTLGGWLRTEPPCSQSIMQDISERRLPGYGGRLEHRFAYDPSSCGSYSSA